MRVQVARISSVLLEVAVEVPANVVSEQLEKAYAALQRKARVRGFRPGKAPRQVLARLYGPQVASDVANTLVTDTLPKALSESQVQPVNKPEVEPGAFEGGAAFSYKARFEVQPDIGDVVYEGLELERHSEIATPAAVDEQLELLRRQHAQLRPPEPPRPAQKGDVLTIDFSLSVDGVRIPDAGAEGIQVELGANQLLAELDAGLYGLRVDEQRDVEARLPDGHPRKDIAGKVGLFRVVVKDLKERILPALDDEFAKDVGNFQTLVELRADIHTKLERMLKNRAESALADQIVDKLNDKNPLDVPPSLVQQQCRMMEMEIMQNARRFGQKVGKEDFQKIHDRVHAEAEKKVRAGLLMAAIARKLDIKITDGDVQSGLAELAAESGKNIAKIRAEYQDPQRHQILLGMILEDKVLNVIESKAKIRPGPAEPSSTSEGDRPAAESFNT